MNLNAQQLIKKKLIINNLTQNRRFLQHLMGFTVKKPFHNRQTTPNSKTHSFQIHKIPSSLDQI
jgi:hypothetical protein